ncbi:SGNH/GDSL hydrolase family protein [Halosaccharopolyspora lacisalsi]|nr:SGNH/GDSL hydrolase family protein [Halosaccharopolyspora lacisalsi]
MTGLLAAPAGAVQHQPPHRAGDSWIGTWTSAFSHGGTEHDSSGRTLRMIVHTSIGGSASRIRLSNAFNTHQQVMDHVTVALAANPEADREGRSAEHPSAAVPGTVHEVTFDGSERTVVPAHARAVSDPVTMDVPADSDLLVSVHVAEQRGPATAHSLAQQTSYVSTSGDHASAESAKTYTSTVNSWFYVDGVDVLNHRARGAVVTLGDSITDGYGSTVGSNHRWPDLLADRLRHQPPPRRLSVLNAGISGNRILLEGINDIQQQPHQDDPERIIAGMKQIVRQARAAGLRVVGGTLTPFQGWSAYTPELEATRQAVDEWIRTSGAFDAVIDFDATVRDSSDPHRLLPAYDSGDHLHPDEAGYRAMAAAIELADLIGSNSHAKAPAARGEHRPRPVLLDTGAEHCPSTTVRPHQYRERSQGNVPSGRTPVR